MQVEIKAASTDEIFAALCTLNPVTTLTSNQPGTTAIVRSK